MINYEHYTYRVTWSPEDDEFIGLCAEFPSLSYLDETQLNALEGIRNLVKEVVIDMQANGEKFPRPLAEKTYSGKFQVRISPDLHRELSIKAAENKMSLNRYVSHRLTYSDSFVI